MDGAMPVHIHWQDVALRLALSALAGGLIGFNRGEHGRPAGLRTTLLVCLAACGSMIQANLLMPTGGKPVDSYVVLDLMRLPLGILSGMGFIGAGAILRRGNAVLGVTTAATLWFVTVMGLCFGGGQIGLGLAMLGLGLIVLWGMKKFEMAMIQDHPAVLSTTVADEGINDEQLRTLLEAGGLRVANWGVAYARERARRRVRCQVRWRASRADAGPPPVVAQLAAQPGVTRVVWKP